MKTAIAVLIALVLAGCAHFQGVQKSGAQLIELDGENRLAIAVDGVETRATPVHFVSARAGGPLHRVLQGGVPVITAARRRGFDLRSGSGGDIKQQGHRAGSTDGRTRHGPQGRRCFPVNAR